LDTLRFASITEKKGGERKAMRKVFRFKMEPAIAVKDLAKEKEVSKGRRSKIHSGKRAPIEKGKSKEACTPWSNGGFLQNRGSGKKEI